MLARTTRDSEGPLLTGGGSIGRPAILDGDCPRSTVRGVWNLRTRRCLSVMQRAMHAGALKGGFRLVHYAVMGNHVHLIVEAPDRVKLARGMQGLGVRIAKALNRVMRRSGRVIGDRYHAHILKTPSEVKRARMYLLTNARHHYGHAHADLFASQVAVIAPRTWLLRRAPL